MTTENTEQGNSPTVPAEGVEAHEPVPKATYTDVHTAKNTTMKVHVPPSSAIIRELTKEEISDGYLTIYLGNSKESRDNSTKLMAPYMELITLRRMVDADPEVAPALKKKEIEWSDFVEKNYPGSTPDDVERRAGDMVNFYSELLDEIKMRSPAIREEGISNVSDRGGLVSPDISGRKPGLSTKNLKDSEIMRRRVINAEDGKLLFDIELRNSFCKLTAERPGKMEMGNLLNDIRSSVKGYVRRVNNNSATLARIAAAREIWKFLVGRLRYSSVNDLGDFSQLASIIRWTDMDALTTALLRSYTNKGVHMHLVCAAPSCDWSGFELVDAEKILHHRDMHDTEDEAAIYANLFNHKVTYTAEETLELIKNANFGLDTHKVHNEDNSIYMELASPSLADAFQTFDYFASRVTPELSDLRTKIINPEEYQAQVNLLYTSLGATEYIHWINKFVGVGAPNTDEKDLVLERSNAKDQADFNKGLMDCIKDSRHFNYSITKAIMNKTPYLSKTFVGLQNFECPKCRANQANLEDPQGLKDRKLGYTPIDPIMSFFTHVQLLLMADATEGLESRVKALSE